MIARYNISGAFVKEAGKVASIFWGELCQRFYDLNQSKGYPLNFDEQEFVSNLPRAIPDGEGDASETPDFEWWAGIWEEAAAAEDGALVGVPGALADGGDQEVAPFRVICSVFILF